jgi:hypothetical protein
MKMKKVPAVTKIEILKLKVVDISIVLGTIKL